jgi:hypothetical protein
MLLSSKRLFHLLRSFAPLFIYDYGNKFPHTIIKVGMEQKNRTHTHIQTTNYEHKFEIMD